MPDTNKDLANTEDTVYGAQKLTHWLLFERRLFTVPSLKRQQGIKSGSVMQSCLSTSINVNYNTSYFITTMLLKNKITRQDI